MRAHSKYVTHCAILCHVMHDTCKSKVCESYSRQINLEINTIYERKYCVPFGNIYTQYPK